MSPPITAVAIGLLNDGSAAPLPMAIGNMPAPMAMVVMIIGRARLWQASISASYRFMPSRRATMAYSTSRMEFFVATPIIMMSPMSDGIEKLLPVTRSATKAPPSESGSAARMVTGCSTSWNRSTSTM